jgi:hypothetical protein
MVSKQRLSVVWALVGCTLAVSGCGSSNAPTPTSTSTAVSAALVKYSECMRTNGVTGFPDPSTTQGPNAMGIDGYNFNLPANLNLQSPASVAANRTCQHLTDIGSSSGPPHPVSVAKARQAAIAHAQCMRDHGVPNFPDPKVTGDGQGIASSSGGPGINARSPAFQQAQKRCAHAP